ncbi:MAG: class I SAM-dependent methyltransferase [Clostridia bacterium]|nr:class I SAM-dependent methyltransferase [Clostridia bacterium]
MKENDIRKKEAHETYLRLVKEDCEKYFSDSESFYIGRCPACVNESYSSQFEKSSFKYVTCDSCNTLYAKTRPSLDKLNEFYSKSVSTSYWVNEFFMPVAEARREKIFRPRAEYFAQRFGEDPQWRIGDIGAGFGIFLDELRKLWPSSSYTAIEPSSEQAEICRKQGFQTECSMLEDLKGYDDYFDFLTAFELMEHLSDPAEFLSKVHRLLKPGGWLWMSTLNGEGFDIQVLWKDSKSIYPPAHINFFNPDSLSSLLESVGFEVLEAETPGQLDWNIVEDAISIRDEKEDRFWKLVAKKATPEAKKELQEWIKNNRFSSHMRILARKR